MKKSLLFLITLSFSLMLQAQENFISNHLASYETDPAFTTVNITDKTFSLFEDIATQDASEERVLGAIAKLNGIKALHIEKSDKIPALYEEARDKILGDDRYAELVSVQTQSENFYFMIREEDDAIRELTIIVGGKDNFLTATLFGDIDLKSMSKAADLIKKDGMKWFDTFENIDSDELVFGGVKAPKKPANKTQLSNSAIDINVYPNPVGDYVQLEETAGFSGAAYELEFFSPIGESVKKIGKVSLPYKIQVQDLPSGAYFLRLTDKQGAFKNYRIVKP